MINMSFIVGIEPDSNAFKLPYGHVEVHAPLPLIGRLPFWMLKSHPAMLDLLSFEKQTQTSYPHSSTLSSLPQSPPEYT